MRQLPYVSRMDSFPSAFDYEFTSCRVSTRRRQTLNFEVSSEPRTGDEDGFVHNTIR